MSDDRTITPVMTTRIPRYDNADLTVEQVISKALYIHQWTSDGGESTVPTDECDCCAAVVVHALRMAGYHIEPVAPTDSGEAS